MINPPQISFRTASAPFSVISPVSYVQSMIGGNNLPVKEGENSNLVYFRVYNNFNGAGSVATMYNIMFTVYDDADPNSHTAAKSPVSQSWVRIYETGLGESSAAPGLYTHWLGTDTAIGRSGVDFYSPEYGSDGVAGAHIRAGADGNGVGYLELATYIQVPTGAGFATYTMAIGINYDWIT